MIKLTLTPRGVLLPVRFDPDTLILILLLVLARLCQRLL
jgi:hypothetical protein